MLLETLGIFSKQTVQIILNAHSLDGIPHKALASVCMSSF
jgi:hypothetical protein